MLSEIKRDLKLMPNQYIKLFDEENIPRQFKLDFFTFESYIPNSTINQEGKLNTFKLYGSLCNGIYRDEIKFPPQKFNLYLESGDSIMVELQEVNCEISDNTSQGSWKQTHYGIKREHNIYIQGRISELKFYLPEIN